MHCWAYACVACCRNAVEAEGVKAVFHLGSILGAVVLLILSRPTDGIRIPMRLPWVISVVMYCFYFSFTGVSGAAKTVMWSTPKLCSAAALPLTLFRQCNGGVPASCTPCLSLNSTHLSE